MIKNSDIDIHIILVIRDAQKSEIIKKENLKTSYFIEDNL